MLDKIFKLKEKNTTVKTEIIAGITTFLSMAYILAVNPSILSDGTGMNFTSVLIATALSAGIASIIMGLYSNFPVGIAPGMGVNALFTYTIVKGMGVNWKAALAAVFLSGIVFLLISVSGVRKTIIKAIPEQLKLAIGAGIGFFIAFVGLKDAQIIVGNPDTLVAIGNLKDPKVLLAIFGILVTFFCIIKKVKSGVFVGLIITAIVGVIMSCLGVKGMPMIHASMNSHFTFNTAGAFMDGFNELFNNIPSMIVIVFSFLFVDFFDTTGTLLAVAQRANMIDEDGNIENVDKAMIADSLGTIIGAALGTSTVTSFVESTSGVEAGGKTGLSAVATGILFLISILFTPLIQGLVTPAVTTPALVAVGVMMAQQLKQIDWDDMVVAISCFITILAIILTYSMSLGIALGFLVYSFCMLATKNHKDVHPIMWVLDIIFIIYFIVIN